MCYVWRIMQTWTTDTPRQAKAGKENTMKKLLAAILIAAAAFAAGHAATMATIDIQTDGDGDSAIIHALGLEYFKGINGYTVD